MGKAIQMFFSVVGVIATLFVLLIGILVVTDPFISENEYDYDL